MIADLCDPSYFETPDCFEPDQFLDKGSNLVNRGAYQPLGILSVHETDTDQDQARAVSHSCLLSILNLF